MPKKDDDISENFRSYEDEESIIKKQEMEEDHGDSVNKTLNTKSHAKDTLLGHTPKATFLASELT